MRILQFRRRMRPSPGQRVLPEAALLLFQREREALSGLRELLVKEQAAEDDIALLRQSELDLSEVFLLVVVGEFNAGKSAFINALVGEPLMEMGVTPTTASITRLRYSPQLTQQRTGPIVDIGYPADWLRDVAIVDTPGTNAILREHEEITRHFVPRADLVLFVTSADRPFTETEREFMERIRWWGKKVVVVLNKADLLATESDLQEQLAFVRKGVEQLLGFTPEVFPVSSRQALLARQEQSLDTRAEMMASSRFGALEAYVAKVLEDGSRVQLKLLTPLGVAERVSRTYILAAEEKRALLAGDIAVAQGIEEQLTLYREDIKRDFTFRLQEVENVLLEMNQRGLKYLDETLRLTNIVELFRQRRIKEDLEKIVVADAPDRIDRTTRDLVEWMVDQDLRIWRSVTEQVDRRRGVSALDGPASRLAGSFDYDRKGLLTSLGQTARQVIDNHDHQRQADELAQSLRNSVAQASFIEVGAIGLGAVSLAIAGSAAADITGLLAASAMAGLGLWILPRKRRKAKEEFSKRSEELRQKLLSALNEDFSRELERSVQRIRDALAPYDRFVRAEHTRTLKFEAELQGTAKELSSIRAAVEGDEFLPAHRVETPSGLAAD